MIEYARGLLALKLDRRGVTALEYGLIAALIAGGDHRRDYGRLART